MHIAAALDRPMVALFGPTNPLRTGPFGHPGTVLRLNLDCSPCYLKKLTQCPYDHRCLREISAQGVLESVGRRLAEPRTGDRPHLPGPTADTYD
jgi:ADP-heptose:LPS heptosyltransferase